MNKKLLLGVGTAALSFAGVWWLKQNIPLAPQVPAVDDNTVLLFQFKYSPYCTKVAKIMDYKGIPYKIVELLPIVSKKFIRELSGQGLVPVIKHRGKIIYDSTVIAAYLEQLKPEPSIYISDDNSLNQEVLLWEDWGDEAFEAPFGKLAMLYGFEHPEIIIEDDEYSTGIELIDRNKAVIVPVIAKMKLKDIAVDASQKDLLKKRARSYLDLLSSRLEKSDFLVGDRLTLADITVASHLTVAQKVPYIYEDDDYAHIFNWQKEIFKATKRRFAASNI
jgi:glutathione S-transferase